ncbi:MULTISPECIES: hypothetical protein [Flavobacteriaceae]|uniref:hypothetical protein n=1 Tax=Flavobacteriaceae TaxID=49546 RepID=UPI0014927C65|nr:MULTISPECIES: hypothetical protein [Allomuricauda]MDC6366573.1 hypothetical protein [Muricauda sp. AC10]
MKNLKIYILLALGVFVASCSEDDKVTVLIQDTTTSGAVLRTLASSGSLDMFDTASVMSWTIQEQDAEGGALTDRIEITASFVDNNGTDQSVSGSALATITEFGETDGLPSFDYSITLDDVLTATGISLDDILPGDQFIIDMELFLTDGRSFKNSDTTGNVSGGSFFSSPYQYTFTVDDGIEFEYEDVNKNEISLTNPNEDYAIDITIDSLGVTNISTLNVYREFVDRSIEEDGVVRSEEEAEFETFSIQDDFTIDAETGIASLSYVIPLDDLYGDNLTYDDLGLNDGFNLRYEIITNDGRIVTTDESGTEYYDTVIVTECIQLNADAPFPGEYTIEMVDDYGDGWNGASLEVQIDGGEVESFLVETGDEATGTFTVPEGATTLVITFISGDWDGEISYKILDPNGNTAAAVALGSAAAGEIELLVCE